MTFLEQNVSIHWKEFYFVDKWLVWNTLETKNKPVERWIDLNEKGMGGVRISIVPTYVGPHVTSFPPGSISRFSKEILDAIRTGLP